MFSAIKLYAAGALLLVLLGCGWYLRHSGIATGEARCRAEMQARVNEATAKATETEIAAATRVATLENDHETEITDLDTRYQSALARHERLRASTRSSGQVPETPSNAGQHPEDPNRTGHAPADGGSDLGPSLILYARDAERLRLALKNCKQYGAEIERFRTALD